MKSPSLTREWSPSNRRFATGSCVSASVVAETNGSTSVEVDPGTVDIRLSGGGGGFANLEYKVLPFLGLEFGTTSIGTDMNVSAHAGLKHIGTDVDVLGMSALTLAANFHFVRTPTVNVYAGTHARLQPLQQVVRPHRLRR